MIDPTPVFIAMALADVILGTLANIAAWIVMIVVGLWIWADTHEHNKGQYTPTVNMIGSLIVLVIYVAAVLWIAR